MIPVLEECSRTSRRHPLSAAASRKRQPQVLLRDVMGAGEDGQQAFGLQDRRLCAMRCRIPLRAPAVFRFVLAKAGGSRMTRS